MVPLAKKPPMSLFGENRHPSPRSAVISDSVLWMWDRSIGSVWSIRPDGSQEYYQRPSSGSRYSHGATTRPDTGEPLVFGGYGNFRAKDFFIYFDTSLGEWRELPHKKGKDDPEPQMHPHIIDVGNGRDVYLIQGNVSVSDTGAPIQHDKQASSLALVFDVSERVWRKTPMNHEVACLITTQARDRQFNFRSSGTVYGGILKPTSNVCRNYFATLNRSSESQIVFWRPETSEWASLAAGITLPTNHYPIGFIFDDNNVSWSFLMKYQLVVRELLPGNFHFLILFHGVRFREGKKRCRG